MCENILAKNNIVWLIITDEDWEVVWTKNNVRIKFVFWVKHAFHQVHMTFFW